MCVLNRGYLVVSSCRDSDLIFTLLFFYLLTLQLPFLLFCFHHWFVRIKQHLCYSRDGKCCLDDRVSRPKCVLMCPKINQTHIFHITYCEMIQSHWTRYLIDVACECWLYVCWRCQPLINLLINYWIMDSSIVSMETVRTVYSAFEKLEKSNFLRGYHETKWGNLLLYFYLVVKEDKRCI